MKYEPRNYQQKAIRFLLEHPGAGLFMEPGLGKTSVCLAALHLLKKREMVERVLVIAPLRVCYEIWPVEAQKWDQFRHLRVQVFHDKNRELDLNADVVCVNPEGLLALISQLDVKRWPFDWLIVDESTRFKHTNTQRFRLLRNVLHLFKRRTILTGTPTPNGMMDLFGQMLIVDLGRTLGKFITHFRQRFFTQNPKVSWDWQLNDGADLEIMRAVKPSALSMVAEDHLDLPERVINNIVVRLPPEARRVYDEMEDELITLLEGKAFTAAMAPVAAMKCRQIANGGLFDDDHIGHHVHDAKTDVIESLVEELGGNPLIVCYEFQHDLERLLKRFPKTPALRGGMSTSSAGRAEVSRIIRDWNRGRLPLVFAQPQTSALGLNLQEGPGHSIAWYGMIWDYEIYDQMIKRLLRSGQKSKYVTVHHIIADDTVDEVVLGAVAGRKRRDQTAFLEGLKSRLSKRRPR